jgi:hypothetical protein
VDLASMNKNMFTKKVNITAPPVMTNTDSNLGSRISDMKKGYYPDFGYKENIDFKQRKSGWAVLTDFISKYPKSERVSNIITNLNSNKELDPQLVRKLMATGDYNLSDLQHLGGKFDNKNGRRASLETMLKFAREVKSKQMNEEDNGVNQNVKKIKDDFEKVQKAVHGSIKSFQSFRNVVS